MNYVLLTLIVLVLIVNPISGKGSCHDSCTKTTYCLSTSGTSCSKDNLVTATWSVSQIHNDDQVTLTLTAKNVKQSEYRAISMAFKYAKTSTSSTNYTCSKSVSGTVSTSVMQKTATYREVIQSGQGSYSGGVLTCSWSFTMNTKTWPLYYDNQAKLMSESRGILELRSAERMEIVANSVADLPTYQLKYLKCCNKVHGNGNYLAIFNQTKDNNYLIRVIGVSPNLVTLTLNSSSEMQLAFKCNFNMAKVEGYVSNRTKTTSITNIIYKPYAYKTFNSRCYWSHPLQLNGAYGKLDTVNQLFDMKIIADGSVVYTEKGVSLKNSTPALTFNSLILVAIFMKLLIQ